MSCCFFTIIFFCHFFVLLYFMSRSCRGMVQHAFQPFLTSLFELACRLMLDFFFFLTAKDHLWTTVTHSLRLTQSSSSCFIHVFTIHWLNGTYRGNKESPINLMCLIWTVGGNLSTKRKPTQTHEGIKLFLLAVRRVAHCNIVLPFLGSNILENKDMITYM